MIEGQNRYVPQKSVQVGRPANPSLGFFSHTNIHIVSPNSMTFMICWELCGKNTQGRQLERDFRYQKKSTESLTNCFSPCLFTLYHRRELFWVPNKHKLSAVEQRSEAGWLKHLRSFVHDAHIKVSLAEHRMVANAETAGGNHTLWQRETGKEQ